MSEEFSVSFKSGGCTDCSNCGLCGKKTNDNITVVTDSIKAPKEGDAFAGVIKTVAAVDLGTTTIGMYLIDATTGEQIGVFTGLNPQAVHGADVISRISHSVGGQREELQKIIYDAIENGIGKLTNGKPKPELIVISGNTVMGHLLMGYDVSKLGVYPFVPVSLEQKEITICGIKTILMPGISAFVGGDIVSGLFTLDFLEKEKPCLLVDLGTNAEMVIGNKDKMIATSAAAGPAFEQKFYATQLISGVAEILKNGQADRTGCLSDEFFETGVKIGRTLITQKEIRELQSAKAAVAAGIEILLKEYGVSATELDKVFIAGGLGYYLDLNAALEVGLFPKEFGEKLEVVGNTSLEGANRYAKALSDADNLKKPEEELKKIIDRVREMNLAEYNEFQEIFIGKMNF